MQTSIIQHPNAAEPALVFQKIYKTLLQKRSFTVEAKGNKYFFLSTRFEEHKYSSSAAYFYILDDSIFKKKGLFSQGNNVLIFSS